LQINFIPARIIFSCSNNFRPLLHVLNLEPEFWRIRLTDLILAEETDALYRLPTDLHRGWLLSGVVKSHYSFSVMFYQHLKGS